MNLAGRKYADAKMASQQKCFQIKAKDAYLMLYGKETYMLEYKKPLSMEKVVLSLKWENGKGLEIKEWKDGQPTGKTELKKEESANKTVSQDMPNVPATKASKPTKQQG
jgi:hypothetical protein